MKNSQYTPTEMMTVIASRLLNNDSVCFVGIGLPSAAANLARLVHAPKITLIYESGTIGAKPTVLPLSIGDGELAETADSVVSTPEIFQYWLQGKRIKVGFLGAAQIDRFGNINTTFIGGTYDKPKVRLPGAGGAPEIASMAGEVFVILKQSQRTFVEKVDFITSVGYLDGGDAREKLKLHGKGPTVIITDLGVLTPDPVSKEFILSKIHPGVSIEQVKEATGWDLKISVDLVETTAPTTLELETLQDLNNRTAQARYHQ